MFEPHPTAPADASISSRQMSGVEPAAFARKCPTAMREAAIRVPFGLLIPYKTTSFWPRSRPTIDRPARWLAEEVVEPVRRMLATEAALA